MEDMEEARLLRGGGGGGESKNRIIVIFFFKWKVMSLLPISRLYRGIIE